MESGSVEVDLPTAIAFYDEPNKVYQIDTISRAANSNYIYCVVADERGELESRHSHITNIEFLNKGK